MATPADIDRLVARAAIEEVVHRYCRGVDRLDRELVVSCYWPEATDSHGSFEGSRDEYVAWLFDRVLPRYEWSFHFVGNVLVEIGDGGSLARCETYGISRHRRLTDRPQDSLTTGFRYVDDFQRRRGEWRIARRVAVLEWSRVEDPAGWWEAPPTHMRGRRDRSDPVYAPLLTP